jgi:AraC family transcriptional regulator, alkane utilization regulator
LLDRRGRGPSGSWLDAMLEYVLHESESDPQPGGYTMQTRLVELMFLDVVRRHIAALPADQGGWLAALRDPYVGRAVGELHADPARAWTLAALAKRVGLSRTILAQRFRRVAGTTPMQYLAAWRLQLASNLLRSDGLSIAEAAARVGYQSEAAFNRAFKRRVGEPPAQWRQRRANGPGASQRAPGPPGFTSRRY